MKKLMFPVFIALVLFSCNDRDEKKPEARPFVKVDDPAIIERGKQIAHLTFKELGGVLKAKMKSGVPEAVAYCSEKAYPLTDSIAAANNVVIRRTALKYRNPENQPDTLETLVLDNYLKKKEADIGLSPVVYTNGEELRFFAPIIVHELCLKCHGTPGEQINESDYTLIKEKYPDDKAVDFKDGDLRGMWSITFGKG